jgi:hypothetical protein
MTNDEINIAIAEYRNWRNIKEIDYQPFGTDPYFDGPHQIHVGIHPESDSDSDEYEAIPNYCSDLNEIHEAESNLSVHEKWNLFAKIGNDTNLTDCELYFATARQRSEAFLKTIGKWEN